MSIERITLTGLGLTTGLLGTVDVEYINVPANTELNIVCEGNSLFTSYPAGTTIPNLLSLKLDDLGTPYTLTNRAGGGETTQQMIEQYNDQVLPLYDPNKRNILIVWEFRNDMAKNNILGSEAYLNVETYILLAKQTGWEIYVLPMLPSWVDEYRGDNTEQGYINFGNERLIANQLLFDNTSLYDHLVDLRELPELYTVGSNEPNGWVFADGQPGPNGNYVDGTHLRSTTARPKVAELIYQKLISTL